MLHRLARRTPVVLVMIVLVAAILGPAPASSGTPTSTGQLVTAAAKKKPKASLTVRAVRQSSGRVKVSITTNARVVKLKYRKRSGRTKVLRLRVRQHAASTSLPAGSHRLKARTIATKRLRTTGWRKVAITVAPTPRKPAPPTSPKPTTKPTPAQVAGIHVSGTRLVDAAGKVVVLHGVNRSGSEYACVDGWGVFDGPSDQASIDAMKSWGVNAVRVPLNSACWLNVVAQFGSYNPAYAGAAYQAAIQDYVDLLKRNGMYAILELHWSGCGTSSCLANWQKPMPDRPYATQFWSSVASRFKGNGWVLFDLFNEPRDVDWSCWRSGGCVINEAVEGNQYVAAGMQEMVNAVRSAGAVSQPILLGGLQYANDMRGWLENLPSDPSKSLVASIHLYNFNWPCPLAQGPTAADAVACFTDGFNPIGPIAARHPVVFGELGQDGCATDFVDPMLKWIDSKSFSVLGWAWNVADCSSFPALIADYDGTPTALGKAFRTSFTGS